MQKPPRLYALASRSAEWVNLSAAAQSFDDPAYAGAPKQIFASQKARSKNARGSGCRSTCLKCGRTSTRIRNQWQRRDSLISAPRPTKHRSPLVKCAASLASSCALRMRCNLVYAMWRIEPESKLVVSVKSNPGEHTSAQCGNRGYQNIKPRRSSPLPALRPGDTHTLRAEMNGAEMKVFADNSLVWEGSVGPLAFDGPVGIRSDNARLQIELETWSAHPAAILARLPGRRI